jgi:O-antigen/teichoic acid export membrane protein
MTKVRVRLGKIITALAKGMGLVSNEKDTTIILKLREVFRNASINIPTSIIRLVANFVIVILLARWLGVSALGQYAIATSIAGIVFGIVNLGIQGILTREVAKDSTRAREYLSISLSIRFFVSFPVGVGISFLLAWVIGFQGETLILVLIGSVFIGLSGIVNIIYGVFHAVRKFEYQFRYVLFSKIISLIGCVILLVYGYGLIAILVFFASIQALIVFLSIRRIALNICPVNLLFNLRFWFPFIRKSFPLALAGTAEFVNLKSDEIMLGAFKGEWDVGIYNSASNIYLGATGPPIAFLRAFFPTFSHLFNKSIEQAARLFRSMFILMVIISCLLALVLGLFSESIVVLIYGEEFISSIVPLIILACGLPFIILNRLCKYTLIGMGFQKWMFYIISSGAIFNVIVNMLFIPKYSFVGASITTVATEMLVFFAVMWKTCSCFKQRVKGGG